MTYTEKAKLSTYKWRETNKELYAERNRFYVASHYEKHKDEKKKTYYYKKECVRFRNILI